MSKDFCRNKKDFAREEFSTEFIEDKGKPVTRENKSQSAQLKTSNPPAMTERKDKKNKTSKKSH